MSLDTNNQGYDAYGPGFRYADIPVASRRNKSGNGTHLTKIRDRGEAGPVYEVLVDYTAVHTPSLHTIDVEVHCVAEVYSVTLEYRENGKEGAVSWPVDFSSRLAARHCDYLLNCFSEIEDAICEEIRGVLA